MKPRKEKKNNNTCVQYNVWESLCTKPGCTKKPKITP
jgi:hypothetical protein